jgi:hypothetical protein
VLDLTLLLLELDFGGEFGIEELELRAGMELEDMGKGASLEDKDEDEKEDEDGGKGSSLEDDSIIGPSIISPGSFSSSSPYTKSNKLSLPSLQDKAATPSKTATSKSKRTFFINTPKEYLLINIIKFF